MEKRLIDVNNAISVLKILSDKCCDDNVFEQAISVLESSPTIDAVPVVRCSECKYLNIVNGKEVYAFCGNLPVMFFMFDVDTREFYCADGEVEKDD